MLPLANGFIHILCNISHNLTFVQGLNNLRILTIFDLVSDLVVAIIIGVVLGILVGLLLLGVVFFIRKR